MLTTFIFYSGKNLFIILPNDDAAAVCITVFAFIFRAISTNPIAVNGFTSDIEACSNEISSYKGTH